MANFIKINCDTKYPFKGWPRSQFINTDALSIVTDFVIKTNYREIEPNPDQRFIAYAKKIYTNKIKTTGLPVKDDAYTINYYETSGYFGKPATA